MSKNAFSSASKRRLTHSQWASAVQVYELGYKNQRQLAEQFGISTAGMHKGLKKRGAVKGCRVEETLVELKLQLARRRLARLEAESAALERMEQRTAMIGGLVKMLIRADRDGTLADLNPLLEEVRRAL